MLLDETCCRIHSDPRPIDGGVLAISWQFTLRVSPDPKNKLPRAEAAGILRCRDLWPLEHRKLKLSAPSTQRSPLKCEGNRRFPHCQDQQRTYSGVFGSENVTAWFSIVRFSFSFALPLIVKVPAALTVAYVTVGS